MYSCEEYNKYLERRFILKINLWYWNTKKKKNKFLSFIYIYLLLI